MLLNFPLGAPDHSLVILSTLWWPWNLPEATGEIRNDSGDSRAPVSRLETLHLHELPWLPRIILPEAVWTRWLWCPSHLGGHLARFVTFCYLLLLFVTLVGDPILGGFWENWEISNRCNFYAVWSWAMSRHAKWSWRSRFSMSAIAQTLGIFRKSQT